MPAANILATDYVGDGQIGSVTFWVGSLSVFSVGAPEGGDDSGGTGGGSGGGCFINTATGGSLANGFGVLPAVVAGLTLLGCGIGCIRRKR